ncbi:hypothetical protein Poly24_31290 [Rosistilla carotiformis]|uniref:Uncharacterized protein n=1 Tax=Rosistilla carotiformis TaxID=2528017 RepID=A0A518JV38_9BACT|nr:hypothetical protein Poly24_31290 [Rosistilla carotiformis]
MRCANNQQHDRTCFHAFFHVGCKGIWGSKPLVTLESHQTETPGCLKEPDEINNFWTSFSAAPRSVS